MKTRVIQTEPDEPATSEERAEGPTEQKRSTNLVRRIGRWSAKHFKPNRMEEHR